MWEEERVEISRGGGMSKSVVWLEWKWQELPCRMVVKTEGHQPVFYAEILTEDALGNDRWEDRRVIRDNNSSGLIYHFLEELWKREVG